MVANPYNLRVSDFLLLKNMCAGCVQYPFMYAIGLNSDYDILGLYNEIEQNLAYKTKTL
ncbi:hypothetical protein bsdcttw_37650 [Anaerocolumna chitinilytica]|uniref:Uncharacterized protein n=1 Tax=Anaerocolumna chitinilytica TaxID=1727145 RepID=A0A7I8DTT1_9FIRM|nr:hypothetical protein bsdcttw_37650 [Anaerocolumna chitinilytica]